MRGNTGGRIDTLERLIARTFPREVVLGEIRERSGARPWKVAADGKRDRTSGAVMRARFRKYEMGVDQLLIYYASISTGAVVMRDGAQLEGSGVAPDETVLPRPRTSPPGGTRLSRAP